MRVLVGEVSVLMCGLGTEMPSIDDVGDSTDHISSAHLHHTDNGSELHFVDDEPLYASDSDVDGENFTAGLSFDDNAANSDDALLGGILSQGQSTVLAALSSPAASNLMTSAATGLTAIRDAVIRAQHSISAQRIDDDASDSDILDAEFDFLNDDEFT